MKKHSISPDKVILICPDYIYARLLDDRHLAYITHQRYAYVFGRDGGLTKIDLLCGSLVKRIIQGGNSIGGAISQDGHLIAVSNYEPGGVKIFSAADLSLLADIPATRIADNKASKTVGMVDAPGMRFLVSLFDTGEIWSIDMTEPESPAITRYKDVGLQPYDALITPDGRYYIAGLFGQEGLVLLDLWHPEIPPRLILQDYGSANRSCPSTRCLIWRVGR